MMTVLLKDQTTGKVEGPVEVGDFVTVETHDENGMQIEIEGEVEEILEQG